MTGAGYSESLELPFLGRDEELDRIVDVRRAGAAGLVVAAGAGVGKSRLARVAVDAAERDGEHVRWVQATRSAAAVPLGAFVGLIPPDVEAEDALGIMRATADGLRATAEGRPIVIGVDDVQLLDPASAALALHLVVSRIAFLVVTLRKGEPRPDAVDALWKDAGLILVDLDPLDERWIGRLVEAALGAPAEERVHRWAYDHSRGNVLYLRELLAGALAGGALEDRDGFWRLTREPPPSTTLTELIGARMAGLEPRERWLLELLALGEPLPVTEIVALTGEAPMTAVEARGLAVVDGVTMTSAVRLSHPLYGEVVRTSMPSGRAREARLKLAELVGARPQRTADEQLRVARWLLDAGEPVPAHVALEAAGAANLAGDADLGARLAEPVLHGDAGARAALVLARAHAMRKRFDEAEAVLDAAEERFGDQDMALEALEHRVVLRYWMLRRDDDAMAFVARAAQRWPDAAWRARVESIRLYLLTWQDAADALAGAETLLEAPALAPEVRRRLELVRASALFYLGRGREAHALALTLQPDVPLRGTHDQLELDLCGLIECETGEDLDGAARWLTGVLRTAIITRDDAAAGLAALSLADVQRTMGRLDDAGRMVAEAIAHLERRDPMNYMSLAHRLGAGVAYERGDPDGAIAANARHHATSDDSVSLPELPNLARAEAWHHLAEGDPPSAQAALLHAADRCAPMPIFEISLRYEAMRAGAPAGAIAAASAAVAARCDSRLAAAYAAHVRARAAGDAPALLDAAEQLAQAGAVRYASECAAHAAEAFANAGRQDSARRAAERSRELHALGQGGAAPEIRHLDAGAIELTPRETQFVELAARGLSNTEIADRLVLSVRTVESHLYRAMQKLGVHDRRELRSSSGAAASEKA